MASVAVTINGRRYEIACDEGQEAQLSRLGRYVDDRVRQLAAAVGPLGDTRLLVMTSLLLADELSDKNQELESYKVEHSAAIRERKDEMITQNLDRLTQRISQIAQILDDPAETSQNDDATETDGENIPSSNQTEQSVTITVRLTIQPKVRLRSASVFMSPRGQ